jgi:hypothetical protein
MNGLGETEVLGVKYLNNLPSLTGAVATAD